MPTNCHNTYNTVKFRHTSIKGFISVIIPVYRDVRGLEDTIKSLLKQTISKDKYEIIVANDGADRQISSLCNKYRLNEVVIAPNKGSYNARNKALEESKGEFLAFTDADVIVPCNWLEKGTSKLDEYPYVGGPVFYLKTSSSDFAQKYEKMFDFNIERSFNSQHYCVTANLFVKRIVLEKIGAFDRRLQSGGDMEFGQRIYFFSQFKQLYYEDNFVKHPHRDYKGILIKKKRIVLGIKDLLKYYPDRFSNDRLILVDAIIHSLIPPNIQTKSIYFFIFIWYMKFIDLYFNLKYRRKNMRIFNKKSHILKVVNKIIYLFKFK